MRSGCIGNNMRRLCPCERTCHSGMCCTVQRNIRCTASERTLVQCLAIYHRCSTRILCNIWSGLINGNIMCGRECLINTYLWKSCLDGSRSRCIKRHHTICNGRTSGRICLLNRKCKICMTRTCGCAQSGLISCGIGILNIPLTFIKELGLRCYRSRQVNRLQQITYIIANIQLVRIIAF